METQWQTVFIFEYQSMLSDKACLTQNKVSINFIVYK